MILFCCGSSILIACIGSLIIACKPHPENTPSYDPVDKGRTANNDHDDSVDDRLCRICFEVIADVINVPCEHETYCNRCVANDMVTMETCPRCGIQIAFKPRCSFLSRNMSTSILN